MSSSWLTSQTYKPDECAGNSKSLMSCKVSAQLHGNKRNSLVLVGEGGRNWCPLCDFLSQWTNHIDCQTGVPFAYGDDGIANSQVRALATMSESAFQTLQYGCSGGMTALRVVGWNGNELATKQSYSDFELSIDVENCEVCHLMWSGDKGPRLCPSYEIWMYL